MTEGHNSERLFAARSSVGRNVVWIASVALIYFATARFSLSSLFQPEGIASIWLSGGIFLSAILLTRRNLRPWLVGVLFMTDLIAEKLAGLPLSVSAIYALAFSGDAVLSSWLLLRFVGEPITFRQMRDVVGLLIFVVVLSNGLWSLVAAAASQLAPVTTFANFWKWWAASDGVGNLLVTPFILGWASWARTRLFTWNLARFLEGAALFIPLALLNYVAFSYLPEQGVFSLLHAYMTFPFLLWAAMRFGVRGVTSSLLILAGIALHFAAAGRDTVLPPNASYWNAEILMQLYLALLAVPSLLLAAVVTERQQSYAALQRQAAEHAALNALGRAANATLALDQTITTALQGILNAVHPDLAFLFLREGSRLVLQEVLPPSARQRLGTIPEHRVGECICGLAVSEGRPLFSRDIFNDLRCTWAECKQAGLKSFAALPLRARDEIIGVVGLASVKERDFELQAGFLETLTSQASIALVNARLFEAVQRELAERQRAEAGQARLTAILESTSDLVLTATPDAKLTYLNQAGRKLAGWGVAESLDGRVISDLHPAWALGKIKAEGLSAAAATGHWHGETALLDREGREVPVSQVILAHRSPDGVLQYYSSVMRDISRRKRDQEALQRSEERYRLIFTLNPLPMWVYDRATLRFLEVNEAAVKTYGYTEDEFRAMTIRDIRPPEDVPALDALVPRIPHGLADSGEWRHRKKDGTIIRVSIRSHDLDLRGRSARLVLAEDITQRRQAEEQLREREHLLSESQRLAHIGSWGWDLTGPIKWTTETYHIFGISPETFTPTTKSLVNLLHSEDRRAMQRWIEACWAGQSPGDLEFRVILPDGSARILCGRGELNYAPENRPAYMAGTVQDITERKRAEAAQREARRLLRAVLDTVPVRVFWKDRESRFLGCNLPFANDAGFSSPDALIGKNDLEMTWHEQAEAYRADDQWVMESGLPKIGYEEPQTKPNGDRIWLRTSKIPLKDAAGQTIGILGTYEDITERKQAEELLQSQAKHLEKLVRERTAELQESVGESEATSYTIAHDMRAPLRAILGYTQILQLQYKDQVGEAEKAYFNHISEAARRMDRLILDVLGLSRVTRAQIRLEPVDLDQVLHGILNSYPAFQPPQVQIEVQGPLPTVLANEAPLTQCISNLLGNAVKFVAPGVTARVRIWAEQLNAPAKAGAAASPDAPSVRLWFADNGIGIAADQQERIFDIFQRVDNSYDGTGIGLAIVRKAMQRMGGKVGLESELGQGARFWLEFLQPNPEEV